MELKPKQEFRDFIESVGLRLPPDTHPLFVIKECGCENDYFILTDSAKRMICKYGYCPYDGICLEVS